MALFCLKTYGKQHCSRHGRGSQEGNGQTEKLPELLINREDAMAVDDIYELKRT